MPGLVDYSDSDSDSQQPSQQPSQSQLPPLPESFYNIYLTGPRTDEVELHNGHTRTFHHVDGQWPTHVYVEWLPDVNADTILQSVLDSFEAHLSCPVESLLQTPLGAKLPLHISLSENLMLETSAKDRFVDRIIPQLRSFSAVTIRLDPFIILLPNRARTRLFITVPINCDEPSGHQLKELITHVNSISVTEYAQLGLISTSTPHLSIGSIEYTDGVLWGPDNPRGLPRSIPTIVAHLTHAKIRVGRDVHVVPFNDTTAGN